MDIIIQKHIMYQPICMDLISGEKAVIYDPEDDEAEAIAVFYDIVSEEKVLKGQTYIYVVSAFLPRMKNKICDDGRRIIRALNECGGFLSFGRHLVQLRPGFLTIGLEAAVRRDEKIEEFLSHYGTKQTFEEYDRAYNIDLRPDALEKLKKDVEEEKGQNF